MKMDEHLQSNWLYVPEDFKERVMQNISADTPTQTSPLLEILHQLLLSATVFGSAIVGINQLLGFIFTVWLSSSVN